jgi:ABC-type sugar transport system ATPase subunit
MSVYHNMFLKRELLGKLGSVELPFLNNGDMRERARKYLDEMGVRIPDVSAEVASCPAASASRSRSLGPSIRTRRSSCSTSRWRRWA